MPYNSRADVVRLLAERYDTKSNVKLGGFQSKLQACYVLSYTEELSYNETVCLWMTICICGHRIIFFRKDIYIYIIYIYVCVCVCVRVCVAISNNSNLSSLLIFVTKQSETYPAENDNGLIP